MVLMFLVALFCLSFGFAQCIPTVEELIEGQGYHFEEHQVKTEDGYILSLHRISNRTFTSDKKGPVILQHGLLCCSVSWVIGRTDKSLGFILADQGYDVWLANSRGNTYSKIRSKYNPDSFIDRKFWDYSFHEMGHWDTPAEIDYILNITNKSQLSYVGHSQGTTQFFIMGATRPEYHSKVKVMVGLAPAAFVGHIKGLSPYLVPISKVIDFLDWLSTSIGWQQMFPNLHSFDLFANVFCKEIVTQDICHLVFNVIGGFDSPQLNKTLVPKIVEYHPAGTSLKDLVHYGQLVRSGQFRQFDYGSALNSKVYGTVEPPSYNLSNIRIPMVLYHSDNDFLADPTDVAKLMEMLPTEMTKLNRVPYANFNHLDYMWASDVDTLLYADVVKSLNLYET